MENLFLNIAGVSGMIIAAIHGYLGHDKILSRIDCLSPGLWRVNYAVFQLSTLYWFLSGLLLILAPIVFDPAMQFIAAITVAFIYMTGAIGNFWATRGRHLGWILLAITSVFALLGA